MILEQRDRNHGFQEQQPKQYGGSAALTAAPLASNILKLSKAAD